MNQQEINNFTRMADALEEEIFRLRKDLNESETLVDVLQRELHDARQELKIAHLEKDILRLELLQAKSAKNEEGFSEYFGATYDPTTKLYIKNTKGEK